MWPYGLKFFTGRQKKVLFRRILVCIPHGILSKIFSSSIVKSNLLSVRYLKEVKVFYVHMNIFIVLYYVLYIRIIHITINDIPVRHVSNCVGHLQVAAKPNDVSVFYCTYTTSPTAII